MFLSAKFTRIPFLVCLKFVGFCLWLNPEMVFSQTDDYQNTAVLSYHNNCALTGVNPDEMILTPANVGSTNFSLVFSYPVDGQVFAQPLVMTNVAIAGKGLHNILIVATEHDSVYAFDADSNAGSNSVPLWHASFINPSAGVTTVPSGNLGDPATGAASPISPEVGIRAHR